MYFKIGLGNPAICPNIEIHQLFQVGVRQAKTSEGAPTPAALLGLGYSQTPLTQFSCSCVLTFFFGCKSSLGVSKIRLPVWHDHVSCETTTGDNRMVHVWTETEERRNIPRPHGVLLLPYISLNEGLKNLRSTVGPAQHTEMVSAPLYCAFFHSFTSKAFFFFFL